MDDRLIKEIYEKVVEKINKIPIEVSARHVHLSEEHMKILFDEVITRKRDLSQPGQYVCNERVTLIGPKNSIKNVAILGPVRKETQVEISFTDGRILGLEPPLRKSGDLEHSESIYLATKKGVVHLKEGVIVAKRHIHMNKVESKLLTLKDGDLIDVLIESSRPIIFKDVLVRVNDSYKLNMHIDYDEANGAAFIPGMKGVICKSEGDKYGA